MRSIQKKQPALCVTDEEVRNVTVAALVHDLGHGPFSHVFDNYFIRGLQERRNGKDGPFWTHEQGSVMMFRYLVESHPTKLDNQLTEDDINQICNLIMGGKMQKVSERHWIYEIVSNPRNGIDVDKIDYMLRDAKKLNVRYIGFNPKLIMKQARVVDDQICYPEKYDFELKKLFESRYNLYRDCYYHRVTQAYEGLILDILEQTDGVLYNYLEAITDPE